MAFIVSTGVGGALKGAPPGAGFPDRIETDKLIAPRNGAAPIAARASHGI